MALLARVPLVAANISTAEMMEVYGQLPSATLSAALTEPALKQLQQEIHDSHCQMLPESQLPAMTAVQQARDARMAQSLVVTESPGTGLRMLVAGNFHIRRDLGVPRYLRALDAGISEAEIVTLALLEVDPESTDPHDYLQQFSTVLPYDFIWFTPAISDEDYCASLQGRQ
jgi:uncharacterized iron-regulated protein